MENVFGYKKIIFKKNYLARSKRAAFGSYRKTHALGKEDKQKWDGKKKWVIENGFLIHA